MPQYFAPRNPAHPAARWNGANVEEIRLVLAGSGYDFRTTPAGAGEVFTGDYVAAPVPLGSYVRAGGYFDSQTQPFAVEPAASFESRFEPVTFESLPHQPNAW